MLDFFLSSLPDINYIATCFSRKPCNNKDLCKLKNDDPLKKFNSKNIKIDVR